MISPTLTYQNCRGIIMMLLILSISISANSSQLPTKKKKKVFTLKTIQKDLFDLHSYPAVVTSSIKAKVLSDSTGQVTTLKAHLGKSVKKGEVLAIIKHTDPTYEYNSMEILSPVEGVINKVNISMGSLINKGQEVFEVINPAKSKVLIEVTASMLSKFKEDMKASLKLSYLSNPIDLKLKGIAPTLDPLTGTATGELEFIEKENLRILIGSLGKVTFKTNQRAGIQIPEHAIVYEGKKAQVRVVENGKLKFVDVTLGKKQAGNIEVLSGLKENLEIVHRVSGFVANGDEVEVQK